MMIPAAIINPAPANSLGAFSPVRGVLSGAGTVFSEAVVGASGETEGSDSPERGFSEGSCSVSTAVAPEGAVVVSPAVVAVVFSGAWCIVVISG